MNRGLAKRPVFVGLSEIRYFQARLAREVRRGEIEVHAFCFLTTHFHLLLRSPSGHLSDVMRRVENSFVRWFNRRYRRDGSLFRGRFTSRLVDSELYRTTVVRYIDLNPVAAGLVASASAYPHGSASYRNRRAPRWLSRSATVEHDEPLNPHTRWVVERRLEKQTAADPLAHLMGAATGQVRRWLRRKARLADGTLRGSCVVSPEALHLAIARMREGDDKWSVAPGSRHKDGWRVLELGMTRDVVGLSTSEASLALGIPRSSAGQILLEHRRLLLVDARYGERAARVLQLGIEITFGKNGTP